MYIRVGLIFSLMKIALKFKITQQATDASKVAYAHQKTVDGYETRQHEDEQKLLSLTMQKLVPASTELQRENVWILDFRSPHFT